MNFIFGYFPLYSPTNILIHLTLTPLRIILIYLFFILFLSECKNSPESKNLNFQTKSTLESISYLALGDSYTIGESVLENERWPIQLADSLKNEHIQVPNLKIIAKTGWTTAELKKGISSATLTPPYDLVSLLIGVNNQYRGYDIQTYKTEFLELLEQSIEFAGGDTSRVFVVSIPNYGVTPFGITKGEDRIRRELLEYDKIASTIASDFGIPFINITPISEDAKKDSILIANDGLHPSGKMYSLWITEMKSTVISLLRQ